MPSAVSQKLSPKKIEAFLTAISELCNISAAAEKAEVCRRYMYELRCKDPEFAAAWDKALQIGADALEDELMRRAKEGVLEPVFYQGEEVATIKKYSDTLGIFLLKGAKPDKYADRKQVTGANGGPIELVVSYEDKPIVNGDVE